ncbi:MAG TPA: hypothetical protein VMD27_08615 [Candidatus Aquilonibacter sp.]|nr:hypothetical protein [Candidatus Aquilonibacter sp.]
MRTKTLLIAAAALVAGILPSKAQVYSANVVGYINVTLTNGENAVCNQLDFDGTGTNNTLQSVFSTNLPNQTKVYAFYQGGWQDVSYVSSSGKWLGSATNIVNANLNPGYGVFVDVPTTLPPTNIVITMVGNVLQNGWTNPVTAGVQIVSCIDPLSGTIDTNLEYAPSKGDKIYTWNASVQNYGVTAPSWSGTKWIGGDPVLQVGQPIILSAASNNVWGTDLIVTND